MREPRIRWIGRFHPDRALLGGDLGSQRHDRLEACAESTPQTDGRWLAGPALPVGETGHQGSEHGCSDAVQVARGKYLDDQQVGLVVDGGEGASPFQEGPAVGKATGLQDSQGGIQPRRQVTARLAADGPLQVSLEACQASSSRRVDLLLSGEGVEAHHGGPAELRSVRGEGCRQGDLSDPHGGPTQFG